MPQWIAFALIAIITLALFHILDWVFWGTRWVHERVVSHIPKTYWRWNDSTQHQQRAMALGMLATSFAALVFVPVVWVLGPEFAGARAVLVGLLLWLAFLVPPLLNDGIFLSTPRSLLWLHACSGLIRVLLGFVLVTWLLSVFGAW